MHELHFNHWAILVSAVIQWLLGAVWYSPALFAKPWAAVVGISKDTSKTSSMVMGMIASFIGSLVTSFVLAHVVLWSGAQTFAIGSAIGLIMWMGFVAAPLWASYIYEGRPAKLFAINTGYWLVACVISGGLLAVWR
jgi:hypothetical protein